MSLCSQIKWKSIKTTNGHVNRGCIGAYRATELLSKLGNQNLLLLFLFGFLRLRTSLGSAHCVKQEGKQEKDRRGDVSSRRVELELRPRKMWLSSGSNLHQRECGPKGVSRKTPPERDTRGQPSKGGACWRRFQLRIVFLEVAPSGTTTPRLLPLLVSITPRYSPIRTTDLGHYHFWDVPTKPTL